MNYYITSTGLKKMTITISYLCYETDENVYSMKDVINDPNTSVTDYAVI